MPPGGTVMTSWVSNVTPVVVLTMVWSATGMGLGLWFVKVTVPDARAVMGVPVPDAVTVPSTVTGTASRTPPTTPVAGSVAAPSFTWRVKATGSTSCACWTRVMVARRDGDVRAVQPTATDRGRRARVPPTAMPTRRETRRGRRAAAFWSAPSVTQRVSGRAVAPPLPGVGPGAVLDVDAAVRLMAPAVATAAGGAGQ